MFHRHQSVAKATVKVSTYITLFSSNVHAIAINAAIVLYGTAAMRPNLGRINGHVQAAISEHVIPNQAVTA